MTIAAPKPSGPPALVRNGEADGGREPGAPSYEVLRTIVESSRDGINVLDLRTGRYVLTNPAQVALTGFTEDEILGMSAQEAYERVHPDDRTLSVEQQRRVAQGLVDGDTVVYRWKVKSGEYRWFSDSRSVVRDAAGEPIALVGISRDVTDAKRAEEQLLYQAHLLDQLGDPVVATDAEFRITSWNKAAQDAYGYEEAEALGRRVQELLGSDSAGLEAAEIRRRIDEGGAVQLEVSHRTQAGAALRVQLHIVALRDPGGRFTGTLAVLRDVTASARLEEDRRRVEEALRESEARLREAHARLRQHVEHTPLALVEWDGDYRVRGYSQRAEEMFGFAPEEVLGKRIDEIPWVPERDWPSVRAVMHDLWTAGRPSNVNANQNLRKDGRLIDCQWYNSALYDASGKLVSILSLVLDVTEANEARAALERSDRRKDEFLAVLSHELRNPLAPIRNALFLLDRAEPGSDPARRARGTLHRQTEHLSRLVDDLLDVARISGGKIELRCSRVDARETVRRACEDLAAVYEQRGVALHKIVAEPTWVDADPARLAQMIGNLLHNALKFTPPGGRVEVAVTVSGDRCRIAVRDTGVGIAPEELARLFTPFVQAERTRARSQGGLGIGLSLVKELARLHGGAVHASSAGVGRGAEFVIELPLAAPLEADAAIPLRPSRAGGVDVLVVEDNEDAGVTLRDLLVLVGHTARVVGTAREAREAAAQQVPDVLLCDIGLPDGSGHDVIRAVRGLPRGGEVLAIALTGYAQPTDREQALRAGFDGHLGKPPDLGELLALLEARARRLRAETPEASSAGV